MKRLNNNIFVFSFHINSSQIVVNIMNGLDLEELLLI
jgi:hypothetical protein